MSMLSALAPTWMVWSLGLTLIGALVGFLARGIIGSRVANGVLALGGLAGIAGSVAYLMSDAVSSRLVLVQTSLFFGTTFELDQLSALFFLLLSIVSCAACVFAIRGLDAYQKTYNLRLVNGLVGLFLFAMQASLLVGNVLGFLAAWELMAVTSFFLVMADRRAESVRAALLYFVMTHLGAAALLAGFFLLSSGDITMRFADLATGLADAMSPLRLTGSFLLLFIGFGSKAGLFPFHTWLPEAHPQAPSHVSALMSAVMVKMALFQFIRLIAFFPIQRLPAWIGFLVLVLGIISAIVGVLMAILEKDIKRALAWSTVENMGLIFMMLGTVFVASRAPGGGSILLFGALFAVVIHAINHALFKSGLFLTAGAIAGSLHTRSLEKMGGLARRWPLFTMAFCVLALAAAALPPFGTFFGEWFYLGSLLASVIGLPLGYAITFALTFLAFVFVSGLAVFAMVRLFAIASLGAPRSEEAANAPAPSPVMVAPIVILAAGVALFGLLIPRIFAAVSAYGLEASPAGDFGFSALTLPYVAQITPGAILVVILAILLVLAVVRRIVSRVGFERVYQTWDCGQPITARNEYTATAFSGPIRFFFRFFLRVKKHVVATPVVASNPWIRTSAFSLDLGAGWATRLYEPVTAVFSRGAAAVRRTQNGLLGWYVGLLVIALVCSLAFAL